MSVTSSDITQEVVSLLSRESSKDSFSDKSRHKPEDMEGDG